MNDELCALMFLSVHDVLRAEKLLLAAGIKPRLIPVPKQVSPDCGLAVQAPCPALAEVRRVLAPLASRLKGCYRIDGASFVPWEG